MLIPDMATYIYGERTSRGGVDAYRIELDLYDEVAQAVEDIEGAKDSLDSYEKYSPFYKSNPDIAHLVPKRAQEEIFYALKNGYASEQVPARVIYLLNKAYKKTQIPNLIFKTISEQDFHLMCQANYLKDVCLRDVVCSFICADYVPITYSAPIQKHKNYAEVYVESTDMIAALPLDIAERMSASDTKKLHVTQDGLCLDDIPLRTLGGRYGATNSIYDLRECL